MNKKQLIKQLKNEYPNDYAVILDSVVSGFKYWIYGDIKIAKEKLRIVTENCDKFKPCTVELEGLY